MYYNLMGSPRLNIEYYLLGSFVTEACATQCGEEYVRYEGKYARYYIECVSE